MMLKVRVYVFFLLDFISLLFFFLSVSSILCICVCVYVKNLMLALYFSVSVYFADRIIHRMLHIVVHNAITEYTKIKKYIRCGNERNTRVTR